MSISMTRDKMLEWLKSEISKCGYCGFCEPVCPTLPHGLHRGYGPRGRVNMIHQMVFGNLVTRESLASLYSCLTCAACNTQCPARMDVARAIRVARALYNAGVFGEPKHEIVIKVKHTS